MVDYAPHQEEHRALQLGAFDPRKQLQQGAFVAGAHGRWSFCPLRQARPCWPWKNGRQRSIECLGEDDESTESDLAFFVFVFLDLLVGNANPVGQLHLGEAALQPVESDPFPDTAGFHSSTCLTTLPRLIRKYLQTSGCIKD